MMLSRKTSNLLPQGRPAYAGLPCGGQGGFTLVELVVSIAIFAIMTALVVAKYGNFNNSLLLTNLAYDVAGTIRTAQTYGLSVKGGGNQDFNSAYAIEFKTKTGQYQCPEAELSDFRLIKIPLTADLAGLCGQIEVVQRYNLTRGASISKICGGGGPNSCLSGYCTSSVPAVCLAGNSYSYVFNSAVAEFKRPDPGAQIRFGECGLSSCLFPIYDFNFQDDSDVLYVGITLKASDGSTRVVHIYKNGQISVGD